MKEHMTVPELLTSASLQVPNREALFDLSRRLTYRELDEESDRLASSLAAIGIQKGDRIGVCLPNWHETVIIYFAVAKIGAVLVPFNPKYRIHEAQHIISDTSPKILFVCDELDQSVGIESISYMVEQIITVRFKKDGIVSFDQLMEHHASLPTVAIDSTHDLFCILYTSGSTGLPKGAMITHQTIVLSGVSIAKELTMQSSDVHLIVAPIFHIFAMGGPGLMGAIASQGKMVLQPKYSPKEALELIEKEKVTVHSAVPTMYNLELNHPDLDSFDLSSLKMGITGGSPCPEDTLKDIKRKMEMKICVSYGLSEVGSITLTKKEDDDQRILETIGIAIPGTAIQIVNDERKPVPIGEVGEIACKGFGIFKGYYQAPEKTEEVYDADGWFYTGDLAKMDAFGYITFIGRKKELIIRGGFNIYPREIEEILYSHPKVAEVAVIGVPDAVMGEVVYAVIKIKANELLTKEEIQDYLKNYIANYKVPSEVLFVEELPLTSSGKIQKLVLKDLIIEKVNKEIVKGI